MRSFFAVAFAVLLLVACGTDSTPGAFQATLPPTLSSAPVYTPTPTFTPSVTPTRTPTLTLTPTRTRTPTPTLTLTPIPPTQPLWTLTPVSPEDVPSPVEVAPAAFAPSTGWSCEEFPCEDDIEGFLKRILVPPGFSLEHVGQFPGQPMQIAYGPDGRLYATVLENGTRAGAVYALNAGGSSDLYSGSFISPVGLAFQPGTDVLYVSARVTPQQGGGLWRILPGGGTSQVVIDDLPCCYSLIDNQPNGMVFGPDGYLYLGVGALTDRAESSDSRKPYADILPYEAAILRIQPHTGDVQVYASGLRNPYDLTFDAGGQFYATDSGTVDGPGDRVVAVQAGAHYGWPYWRARGCDKCPLTPANLDIQPDLFTFPNFSLPRGLVAYTGTSFPQNLFNNVFVTLWNGTPDAQRVVRVDPRQVGQEGYAPEPFITGLIRPVDIVVAPDGSLVVADFIYGHVWKVRYEG